MSRGKKRSKPAKLKYGRFEERLAEQKANREKLLKKASPEVRKMLEKEFRNLGLALGGNGEKIDGGGN